MGGVNYVVISGRLAKDPHFVEDAPRTDIILVNSRELPGSEHTVVTTVRVVFRGTKAIAASTLRKGDEICVIGGCLQDDNYTNDDGERSVGRLRIESVDKFYVNKKKEEDNDRNTN